jgi:hypothetical protein
MATGLKFFFFPFGDSGDITPPTPDPTQAGGVVSYETGWTSNYELPLASGGSALAINRIQMNSLFNDITSAVKNIQIQGIPSWIGPSNDTPPLYSGNFAYPINALAYYTDGNVYQSLKAANTDTPGATANWLNVSANAGALPIGTVIDFAGVVAPANYLPCDNTYPFGTGVSRTTYANLLGATTVTQNGSTTVSSTSLTGVANIAFLAAGMPLEGAGIPTGTTVISASGTTVVMSQAATAAATVPVTFFPWGNGNGTTTFDVPNSPRANTVGSGGSATSGSPATTVGSRGGAETSSAVPSHTHGIASATLNGSVSTSSGPIPPDVSLTGADAGTPANTAALDIVIANNAGSSNINLYAPSVVMLRCVKYQ